MLLPEYYEIYLYTDMSYKPIEEIKIFLWIYIIF